MKYTILHLNSRDSLIYSGIPKTPTDEPEKMINNFINVPLKPSNTSPSTTYNVWDPVHPTPPDPESR